MMKKAFIGSLGEDALSGKVVLLRVDFNVPLHPADHHFAVENDARIRAALPTIRYLQMNKAKVVICSHLGRPTGKDLSMSLRSVATRLSELLHYRVTFVDDCIGVETQAAIDKLQGGEVVLLENLRFHPGEEANDADFARQLAQNVDIYVNDAFGAAHRAHASTEGVAHFVQQRYAGYLMRDELHYLGAALDHPHRPFCAVVGGAKVSTKLEVLLHLLGRADKLLVGGAMAYTFCQALGYHVGASLVERDCLKTANEVLEVAEKRGVKVVLACDSLISPITISVHPHRALPSSVPSTSQGGAVPQNVLVNEGVGGVEVKSVQHVAVADTAEDLARVAGSACRVARNTDIPDDWVGVDIGTESIEQFKEELSSSRTIMWNGPLGLCENPLYSFGTTAIAQHIAMLTKEQGVVSVVCGGDTLAAIDRVGVTGFSHVSTGGGAALEFLEGKALPGVAALCNENEVAGFAAAATEPPHHMDEEGTAQTKAEGKQETGVAGLLPY
jgi:phosphoglycerate kinase